MTEVYYWIGGVGSLILFGLLSARAYGRWEVVGRGRIFFALAVLAPLVVIVSCVNDEDVKAEWDRHAEAVRQNQIKEQTPRIISRSADGCTVYTFKAGERWHYFTRCANSQTKTDTSYIVRQGSGKQARNVEKFESITTEAQ